MIALDDVKQMLNQADDQMFTLYLNVNPARPENQAQSPAWSVEARHALDAFEAKPENAKSAEWKQTRAAVEAFLENYVPQTRTLALFTSPGTQQSFELPLSLETQAYFGQPNIAPLLWLMDEYEPYLVVMVDQEKARFLRSYIGDVSFEDSMEIELAEYDFEQKTLMPAQGAFAGAGPNITQGSNREAFQNMLNEHHARFYRQVVDRADELMRETGARRMFIGGAEQAAHHVYNELPEKLKETVVKVTNVPMRTALMDVFQELMPDAQSYEREGEEKLLTEVIDFAKSGGRGALGEKAVREAMEMQQVEMLILPWPLENEELSHDLIHHAMALNANYELVHGPAADRLRSEGGVAARLYYTLNK
jgi:hypothetical protein